MAKVSVSYYSAKFFRSALIGLIAAVFLFLPRKLLELFGFGPLLERAHNLVTYFGVPSFMGRILTVVIALAVVAALGWLVMRILRTQSRRIPLVQLFMRTVDRFDDAFRPDKQRSPKPVVVVAWPNETVRTVGMVMRKTTDEDTGRTVATVYIPNSPNPMSGILRFIDVEKLEPTDWTVDDALALAFSRGALKPVGGEATRGAD
jgi:uncharacterized membrane protein